MGTGKTKVAIDGSSPRTWGNANTDCDQHPPSRFIPTHVGKCQPEPGPEPKKAVHPHARGEMA